MCTRPGKPLGLRFQGGNSNSNGPCWYMRGQSMEEVCGSPPRDFLQHPASCPYSPTVLLMLLRKIWYNADCGGPKP